MENYLPKLILLYLPKSMDLIIPLTPDWRFMEDYIKSLKYEPPTTRNSNTSQEIDILDWYEFRFGDLISDIYKAKAINKEMLTESESKNNCIRYITRTGDNNGCELLASLDGVNTEYIESGNAITIGDTTATCFYQENQFITGDHMVVIRADWLNKYTGLFVVAVLSKEQYKYNYGRAYLMDRIKDTMIKLPSTTIDDTVVPDWEYIKQFVRQLPYGDRI